MIVRAAGRKQRRNTSRALVASFAQLRLPFLAPAQLRWSATHATAVSNRAPNARLRDVHSTSPAGSRSRHLATAADQYTHHDQPGYPFGGFKNASQEQHVPWDYARPLLPSKISNLRPYSDPIVLNTSLQTPLDSQVLRHGIGGSSMDLLQHLYTCLRVGRLSRAEAVIHRLALQSQPNSPEILHAQTALLEESLKNLAGQARGSKASMTALKDLQKWFEVGVRDKGTKPDARLLVIMIRASIRALDGDRRDRSIRRYVDMARDLDEEEYGEVMYSEEYDDDEFTVLGRVTSNFHEVDKVADEMATGESLNLQDSQEAGVEVENLVHAQPPAEAKELPDVRPVDQKGLGLDTIKVQLKAFREATRPAIDASEEERVQRAHERQKLMEETAVETAIDRWRKEDEQLRKIGIHTFMQSKPIGALMWQWHTTLLPVLETELKEIKKGFADGKSDERFQYGPYLELMPLHKIAANTILYVMSRVNDSKNWRTKEYSQEVKISSLALGLGKTIESEALVDGNKGKVARDKKRADARSQRIQQRQLLAKARRSIVPTQQEADGTVLPKHTLAALEWPTAVKVKLGAMLISKLIETAQLPVTREHPRTKEKITQLQPAFLHKIKYTQGKKSGLISPNPALTKKVHSEPVGSLIAKRMPMIVEPRPWTSFTSGGYMQYSTPVVRLRVSDKSCRDYFLAAEHKGDMKQIFAGLNALGKIPWRINRDVLKVQLEAWNSGEAVANLAPIDPKLDLPPEPEPSTDSEPRRKWLAEVRDAENKRSGLHSQRCFQNFQLEIARAFVDEKLYFPHNIDFRGRAYPIPPYLNHMGADNARGLLVFAEGKPLGENGLQWLKIHLANVAGYDKASLKEREEFTMEHLDDIYDSVRSPLGGRRWWLKSEDAWQTLAACFELTKALDSPNPTEYVSYMPVHQDGTCNGLQHYAALGGDKIGAAQVNLEPGDRPADVYTAVAEVVKQEIQRDCENNLAVAKALHGRITRKVVKQPVMTNVYGVTYYGAREQVRRQLQELMPEVRRYDSVNHNVMSTYIAEKIFKALGTMFTGAQKIQHWLGTCADRISTCLTPEQIAQLTQPGKIDGDGPVETKKTRGRRVTSRKVIKGNEAVVEETLAQPPSGTEKANRVLHSISKPLFKSTVIWTTPLRLPVVQPYRTTKSRTVVTNLQRITLQEPQVWDPVSKRKQLQAFPPNFIHSLDATHMILSALKCNEIGMSFASIHDSFWTHACDVGALGTVLRDAFVAMHSDNIVGRLKEEFEARYKGCMFLATVDAKSELGKKVTEVRKRSKAIHGGSDVRQMGELAVEAERLRLISSEDTEEKAKGEAMETPGSVVARENDQSAFAIPQEILKTTLGDIPESQHDGEEALRAAEKGLADYVPGNSEDILNEEEGVVSGSVLDTDVESLAETSAPTLGDAAPPFMAKRKSKNTVIQKIYVWLPMSFPEVPEKGGFDVARLRQSRYFFH